MKLTHEGSRYSGAVASLQDNRTFDSLNCFSDESLSTGSEEEKESVAWLQEHSRSRCGGRNVSESPSDSDNCRRLVSAAFRKVRLSPTDGSLFSQSGASLTHFQLLLLGLLVVGRVFGWEWVCASKAAVKVFFSLVIPLAMWTATIRTVKKQKAGTVKRMGFERVLKTLSHRHPKYAELMKGLERIDGQRRSRYKFLRKVVLLFAVAEVIYASFLAISGINDYSFGLAIVSVDLVYNLFLIYNRYWRQEPSADYMNSRFAVSKNEMADTICRIKEEYFL
eukprot:m.97502 g.97502  ORF g.97502 m.97502 type:complete len:279 (+) comp36942_c0_seq1:283-1119(+)